MRKQNVFLIAGLMSVAIPCLAAMQSSLLGGSVAERPAGTDQPIDVDAELRQLATADRYSSELNESLQARLDRKIADQSRNLLSGLTTSVETVSLRRDARQFAAGDGAVHWDSEEPCDEETAASVDAPTQPDATDTLEQSCSDDGCLYL